MPKTEEVLDEVTTGLSQIVEESPEETTPIAEETSVSVDPPSSGIVSVAEFNTYTGNYEDGEAVVAMKVTMLKSAQEVVKEYLNFDPESAEYEDIVSGIGNNHLYLFAHPITAVTKVALQGVELESTDYSIKDRYLYKKNGIWPNGVDVEVSYTAGWSAETLPDSVKMAIMQIAALKLQESGGNIGITGKSFAENSRSFINYTNYEKWLKPLDPLRIVRLY